MLLATCKNTPAVFGTEPLTMYYCIDYSIITNHHLFTFLPAYWSQFAYTGRGEGRFANVHKSDSSLVNQTFGLHSFPLSFFCTPLPQSSEPLGVSRGQRACETSHTQQLQYSVPYNLSERHIPRISKWASRPLASKHG